MMLQFRCYRKLRTYQTIIFILFLAILWILLLETCLISNEELCQNDQLLIKNNIGDGKGFPLRMVVEMPTEKVCSIFSLKSSSESFYSNQSDRVSIMCKPTPPHPQSCDIANKLFFSEPPESCSHQSNYQFCSLKRSQSGQWTVGCNETEAQVRNYSLSLGLPSPKTGILDWTSYDDAQKLASNLTNLLNHPEFEHFGFAFIRCKFEENYETKYSNTDHYSDIYYQQDLETLSKREQLLILPPVRKARKDIKEQPHLDISINIILVDSTSRQHFFRSLKKSVSALETISDPKVGTRVLDYELMQALKSRTFETLQAIFTGYVNITETPFPIHGIPPKPLNLSPVFEAVRKKSYRTLWLEDLCYLWEWGISKDLHFLDLDRDPRDTWKVMWRKLKDNGIDDIDLTLSMCRILDASSMKDPFRHTHPVCFNGKHQHEYLLEYLRLYQTEMQASSQASLTFTMTNVGHEESGRRIQTLDDSLADYISFLPALNNTLSIIFSDHGNAYGQFFTHSQEAQSELFHPFMFFIIPEKVSSKLGHSAMSSLKKNSKRLVTALDLHYSLLFLATSHTEDIILNKEFPVSRKGLFELVDPLRMCDSVPRIPPNLCICENGEIAVDGSSYQALFGYHAVGAINAEIQRQFVAAVQDKSSIQRAYGRCEMLILKEVKNIRENKISDKLWKISMEIHVQESQVFFVSIIVKSQGPNSNVVSLETFSRISKYAVYKQCVDPGLDLSLCVCNISASFKNLPFLSFEDYANMLPPPHFQNSIQHISGREGCLCVFTVFHSHGMAVFVISTCQKYFIFNIELLIDKMFIYYVVPSKVFLLPNSNVYLALVVNKIDLLQNVNFHAQSEEVKSSEDFLHLL